MILQALNQYYEDLARADKIARPGWAKAKISYALCIDENGELEQVVSLLTDTGKKKPSPREFDLPAPVIRHGNVYKPNYMWDNSSYFLGVDNKGKPKRSEDCFKECKRFHHQLLDSVNSPGAKALLRFFDHWQPAKASEHPALQGKFESVIAGANLIFLVNGAFPHENEAIQEAWQAYYNKAEGKVQQCLVTGKWEVLETAHPSIRGIGQKAESALVSFNETAFCSYGNEKRQGDDRHYFNAPVGKSAAFAYTAALNYLIADREHVQKIGDTTVVCWAEGAEPQYQDFSMAALFGAPPPEGFTDNELYSAVKRLVEGWPCEELKLDPNRPFYILGLSPNAARLSVRFFYRDTFGQIMRNVNEHHRRMKIVCPSSDLFPVVPLWKMLQETVNMKSQNKSPSPAMAGATARAIFSGTPYPASLLENVMLRIQAERKITHGRAAIIKAYYVRLNDEFCNVPSVMEGAMEEKLNKSCTYQPYVLGELFAVMEKIQTDSAGGADNLNRTIKDSYFTTAAATPNVIFAKLFPLSEYHMKKLKRDKPQFAVPLDKRKAELIRMISGTIPDRMSADEVNCFYIGYYHQRDALYKKKEEA